MKRLFVPILLLIVFFVSLTLFGQELQQKNNIQLELTSVKPSPSATITKEENKLVFHDSKGNIKTGFEFDEKPYRISIAENGKNATVSEPVNYEEGYDEKMIYRLINLLNDDGDVIATSKVVNLLDRDVVPMGDNETVLLIFPAGVTPKATVDFYKKRGETLEFVKSISKETGDFSWDVSYDGKYFLAGYSAWKDRGQSQMICFDNSGNELWSKFLNEDIIGPVYFSDKSNFIFLTAQSRETNERKAYLLDLNGREIVATEVSARGTFYPEFSDDEKEKYVGISSGCNEVLLIDTESRKVLWEYKDENKKLYFNTMEIVEEGNVFLSALIKKYSPQSHVKKVVEKKLYIFDREGRKIEKQINLNGIPRLFKYEGDVYIKLISEDKETNYKVF